MMITTTPQAEKSLRGLSVRRTPALSTQPRARMHFKAHSNLVGLMIALR